MKKITANNILDLNDYAKVRSLHRKEIIAIKKNRRVHLGPITTFYFENFQTMLYQVQEMLFIEKGGKEQLDDELNAYNPLIPQGQELIATFMIEVSEPNIRRKKLYELADIEDHLFLSSDQGDVIRARTIHDGVDRTTDDGKTSAIHFVKFMFSDEQVKRFLDENVSFRVESDHACYIHASGLNLDVRRALIQDFER